MANRPNYLLGYGERLSEPVDIKSPGRSKFPPYQFDEARDRLVVMLKTTVKHLNTLPESACPGGQTVASFTLHPEYLAKSYFPGGLLQEVGLRSIGSKSRMIKPQKRSHNREPKEMLTTQLFVAGARSSFKKFADTLPRWLATSPNARQLPAIEEIAAIPPTARMRPLPRQKEVPLEIVLHASESQRDRFIIQGFQEFLEEQGLVPDTERIFFASRLCFLRMYAPPRQTQNIAKFSFLRVLREMPKLRATNPLLRSNVHRPRAVELPTENAIDPKLRIALFDGGIDKTSPLLIWTDAHDALGVGDPDPDLLWHGETVTSAALFGSANSEKLEQPVCHVDHYRVLDTKSKKNPFELYEVLDRIKMVLDTHPHEFISLSIGPELSVDDDEVHAWTSVLDDYLSDGRCLATIAAGNTGREPTDLLLQQWRIQVPSDCVNGLTVGSADRKNPEWNRADYSSRGPGRSPGIVKPDLLTFGGSEHEPFWVCDPDTQGRVVATAGTSYAAPSAIRGAAAVRAHFGSVLNPLAIKALLIHGTNDGGRTRDEVGWGYLPDSIDNLTVCPDGCVRIVYQDEISAAKYRRIRIPMPREKLQGNIHITATFCFATEVDPEHPGNYTRSGLSIVFRPDMTKFKNEDAVHPKSGEFFQPKKLYPIEQELRIDAHKWETCLHMNKRKQACSLNDPVFDIHYNARSEGHIDSVPDSIRYALIITVEAPKVKDLYNRIVRAYPRILQPLNPIIEVPVRL